MSNPTPGPWIAKSFYMPGMHGTRVQQQLSGVTVAWCGCNAVASTDGKSHSIGAKEAQANALLIAESPAMRDRIRELELENAALRHDLQRSMANHVADLNALPKAPADPKP